MAGAKFLDALRDLSDSELTSADANTGKLDTKPQLTVHHSKLLIICAREAAMYSLRKPS